MTKLILTRYEQSVCRVHFLLVGSVISFLLILMSIIIAATHWYHYAVALYGLITTCIVFYSSWTLHIRMLVFSGILLFIELALESTALILMGDNRVTLYRTCYLSNVSCEYDDWQAQLINLPNGIAFMFPATIITFVNLVSIIQLVYLFRNVTHS